MNHERNSGKGRKISSEQLRIAITKYRPVRRAESARQQSIVTKEESTPLQGEDSQGPQESLALHERFLAFLEEQITPVVESVNAERVQASEYTVFVSSLAVDGGILFDVVEEQGDFLNRAILVEQIVDKPSTLVISAGMWSENVWGEARGVLTKEQLFVHGDIGVVRNALQHTDQVQALLHSALTTALNLQESALGDSEPFDIGR